MSPAGRRWRWTASCSRTRCRADSSRIPASRSSAARSRTIPSPSVIATGPLTSNALATALRARLGVDALSFYDAIAPVVSFDSIDHEIVFKASRYGKGETEAEREEGAYLNCPMSREQYEAFIDALVAADKYQAHEFDEAPYFEGCLPVEEMAARGRETLRFGPLKPVGLRDPRTGRDAYAVVQLRQEDRAGRMWNLVGFQTRLRIGEQERVFRSIPGLANAEFLRHGSIHRNSYVNSPAALTPALTLRDDPTGLSRGTDHRRRGLHREQRDRFARGNQSRAHARGARAGRFRRATTMLGALYRYLREADPAHFQPMNANFGLLDDLAKPERDKRRKRELFAERALADIESWQREHALEAALPVET